MSKYVQDNEWGTKYPNFRKEEFKCPCCGGYGNGIATSLLDNLQTLRNKYGSVEVTSGYRCQAFNKKVGGDPNSAHLKGQAVDFYFGSGILANQNTRIGVVNEIKKMPNYHYSYCNVNGNYPNMGSAIHMDTNLTDDRKLVAELQHILNEQYGCGLAEDNSFGNLTANACNNNYLYKGKNAPIHVKWLQTRLIELGYSCGSWGNNGVFGEDTLRAVKLFQAQHDLDTDGLVGKKTHRELVK